MRTTKKDMPPDGTRLAIVLWRCGRPYLGLAIVNSCMTKGKRPKRAVWIEHRSKELDVLPDQFDKTPLAAIENEIRAIIRANAITTPEDALLEAIFGRRPTRPLEVARQLSALLKLWRQYKARVLKCLKEQP